MQVNHALNKSEKKKKNTPTPKLNPQQPAGPISHLPAYTELFPRSPVHTHLSPDTCSMRPDWAISVKNRSPFHQIWTLDSDICPKINIKWKSKQMCTSFKTWSKPDFKRARVSSQHKMVSDPLCLGNVTHMRKMKSVASFYPLRTDRIMESFQFLG